jgi:Tat protein translocase TatB subunit
MSFSETVFLFVLALVIFGPKKLPEIARQLGKYMAEFRRASNEFKAQIEQEISHLDIEDRRKASLTANTTPASAAPEGTASRSTLTALPPPVATAELAAEPAGDPAASPAANSAASPESSSTSSSAPATPPASQESHA